MINASLLSLSISVPSIDTEKLEKFEWRNAYEKVSEERLKKSAAFAENAPKLKSVIAEHYVLSGDLADGLLKQLPAKLLEREVPVVIYTVFKADGPSQLILHKDWGRLSVINVYVEAQGSTTTFYEYDRDNNLVQNIESFCAASGEVWAMNSKILHGVVFDDSSIRTMINFAFRRQTLESIIQLQ